MIRRASPKNTQIASVRTHLSAGPLGLLASAFIAMTLAVPVLRAAAAAPVVAKPEVSAAVTVTDNGRTWTLDNGIVKATINKRNGNMTSLVYHGIDTMGGGGYWEQTPQGAPQLTQTVTIDPAKNGGERAEVAVKGVTGGTVMLTPGAPGGGTYCDIEVRYALGRGDSGIYAYAIFSHPAAYGAMGVGESRYITKLNHDFNWISVDADRNMLECTPQDWGAGVVIHAKEQRILSTGLYKNSVEHKYSYNAVQYKIPAYGWSSTKDHIGVWFINPTIEYLSGGASKLELVCHFDANDNPDPIILDYWRGRPLRRRRELQHRRRRRMEQGHRPDFCLLQRAGRPQDPLPGRSRHAGSHRRQSHRAARLEGQRHRPVAGRARPGQEGKGPVALRLGQRRGLPAQGTARHRHRPTRAQRSAGGHDQAAPSDRRPGPPGLRRRRQADWRRGSGRATAIG